MTLLLSPRVLPILMLVVSNVFMIFAWYGHLRFKGSPIYMAVVVSWMIAFFEYWLAVPANRIGSSVYSAAELKTMQEVITLSVFAIFSVVYLKEALTWNHAAGFALIAGGAGADFQRIRAGSFKKTSRRGALAGFAGLPAYLHYFCGKIF